MSVADDFLEKLGLKIEDLDSPGHMGEKEAYFALLREGQGKKLTVEDIRANVIRMRYSVEMELTDIIKKSPKSQEVIYLSARLRNYVLLEAALYSPQTAGDDHRKDIEDLVSNKKR